MKILTGICFSVMKNRRTRGNEVTLVKELCRLDMRMFSFSQLTKLIDCVHASNLNMYTLEGWVDTCTMVDKKVGLDKPEGFLAHLPSGINFLGGNPVKSRIALDA